MEIITDIKQGDPEWFKLRIGSIGGSSIASVVAGGQGKMRKNLMYRLAGEILSDEKYEGYSNPHMLRGIEQEPDSLAVYEAVTGNAIYQPAIVKESKYKHYSPDSLRDPDGIVECKSAIPSIHVERIDTGKIEGNYYKQIQWGLHICQRKWCDFVSYSPLVTVMPIWIKRYTRDEKLIKELDSAADKFLMEMMLLIKKIKEA